jgi:GAF domain-containing protein
MVVMADCHLVHRLQHQGAPTREQAGKVDMSSNASLLQDAVAALNRYFVSEDTLSQTLHRVAELTMRALPQTTHVGITMMVDGRAGTAIFSDPEVPEIDQAQYRTGRGPCLDAFKTGVAQVIPSTLERGSWQEFRDSAARHGVLSTLSLPLTASKGTIGALNLYAGTTEAYQAEDVVTGELFAAQAAFVLANAQAYWDARSLSENLTQAMQSRATIEQAKGILMATTGCTPDGAIQLLIQQSQAENIKLRELAAQIVNNAMRKRS